ncbi:MAG TPA: hypothetical protein DD740_06245 [Chryseobacterium sp.]|nr:hypothetical protein [Chryseobacterium sp.]
MKLYIISGLGADEKVLEKLSFNPNIQPVHISWLIPEKDEEFHHYIGRMADCIDNTEDFYLMGYSFGGIIAQEIHKIKPAKKVVILGSIRSDKEKSRLIKLGEVTHLTKYLPVRLFNENSAAFYTFFRKLFDPKNPVLLQYFRVRDPYYLKWSVDKISAWRFDAIDDVIQIMGDRDIVFPLKNSRPDYVIKNATHLFPATKAKQVSDILKTIFV